MIAFATGRLRRLAWILLLITAFAVFGAAQANHSRILIVYTYRSNVVPYPAIASAFQTTLVRNFGDSVEFHEISLDYDRFPAPSMQADLADFLRKRFSGQKLDLIVSIGAPAAQFILQHRDFDFAGSPVLFLAADSRFLSPETHRNATIVTQTISPATWIEDILQIAPDTKNIVFLMGVSPLERTWSDILRRELQGYSNRVKITFFENMSFDEIEKRVSALPAHTVIHSGLLIRDAAGVSYGGHEILQRLHAAANAPVYGIYGSQLGSGTIGGRLYQDRLIGVHGAESAARILRGEPAESIPGQILPLSAPMYDWRELKRWDIPVSRLPAGSSILFREPTFAERYRWHILAVIAFVLIETMLVFFLLITFRKRRLTEESLRQSEQKYRRLHESMMDAFVTVDMAGHITEYNPAYQQMLGYAEAELIRLTYPEITPEHWHKFEAQIIRDQVLPRGYSDVYEKEYRRRDGTVFPVELRTFLLRDENGTPTGMWAIVRDITERKRAAEAMRQRNRYIETIMEEAPIGFAVHTVDDGVGRFVSARYDQIYGVPRGTIDSHNTFFDKVWPRDLVLREQIRRRVVADMESGDPSRMHWEDIPVPTATGEIRYISAVNIPVLEQNLMVSTVQDVTRQVKAQESLRESEERLRQITETVSDFVWEVDAAGLYAFTSPSVEKILGYTPDELVGKKHFYDLFAPDVREELKTAALQAFERLQPFQAFPNSNLSKSGKIVLLETSGKPILDEAGHLLGYRGADTDVTARHQAEVETQTLRQELALFSRVATTGELAASIAHELNQPLAAILSNAQAALRLMQDKDPDMKELREIFEDIAADDQRAAEVIRSLRSLLKKDTGEHRPLMLNSLVKDVLSIVRNDGLARKISIDFDSGSVLPPVNGDRVQLQQVILNLVMNAFEAMDSSEGSRELKLRTRRDGKEIILDVMDSGFGIPPAILEAIFEPFFTTKHSGLGMGLALSRTIVAAHSGRLWAENNPETGATFHMALPAEKS
jgi:PAS domain S-box-containing protein